MLSRAARDLQKKKDREQQQRPGSHVLHNRVVSRPSSPGLMSHNRPAEHEPKRRKFDATHKQQGLSSHHSTASPLEAPQPESSADDGVAARRPRPPKANGYVTANSSQHRNSLLAALKTLHIPPPAEEPANEIPASPALTRSGRPSQQQQKHRRRDSAEGDLPNSVPTHGPSHTFTAKPAKPTDQQPLRESRHASAVNGPQVGGISHPAPGFPGKNQSRKRQRPENIEDGGDATELHGAHQQPLHAHLRQGGKPHSKLFPASLSTKSVSSRSHDWPPVGPSSLPRTMSNAVVRKAHSPVPHATGGTTPSEQEGNHRNRNHVIAASTAHQQAPAAAPTKALHKRTLPSAGKSFLSKHRVSSPPPSERAAARAQQLQDNPTNADRKQQFLQRPASGLRTNHPSTRSAVKHVPNHRAVHKPHHSGLPRSTSTSPAHRGVMVSPLKKRRGKLASVLVRHAACKVSHGLTKSLLADAALRAAGHHGRRIQKH